MNRMNQGEISQAFAIVTDLAKALGVAEINKIPGCWEHQIDDLWHITINGHREPYDGLPPYHMAVRFNGWPAGVLNPFYGVIASGEAANEDDFISAVKAAISQCEGSDVSES